MRKPLTLTLVALLALAGTVTYSNRHEATASGPTTKLVLDVPVEGGSWRVRADGSVSAPDGVFKPANGRVPRGATLVDAVATPSKHGYWGITTKGSIVRGGDAAALPRVGKWRTRGRAAAIAALPDGTGLYVVGANGTVSTYGTAPRIPGILYTSTRIVDAAVSPTGNGLWMATIDGEVYAIGDAANLGGIGVAPNSPITAMTPTASGQGYWLVSADGGVFAVGDAFFRGSLVGIDSGEDVVGLQIDRDGYLLLGAFDRVDAFGNGAPMPDPVASAAARTPRTTTTTRPATTTTKPGVTTTTRPPATTTTQPATTTTRPTTTTTQPPVSTGGSWFAGTPWLYGAVPSGARLDPMSSTLAAALAAPGTIRTVNVTSYGVPVYEATASTPRYQVTIRNGGTNAWGVNDLMNEMVPIPDNAVAAPGYDGKMVIIDRANNKVYDLWTVQRSGSGWSAGWGGVYPLNGDGTSHNPSYQNGVAWPNPVSRGTGSGISSLSGIITTSEIAAGQINHALVFATDIACGPAQSGPFRYPATTTDGYNGGNCVPEGTRVQIDPSIDLAAIPGISKAELAVGRAMQTYGAYLIDNGGSRMGFIAQMPTASSGNPYPAAGFGGDYNSLNLLPWQSLRVLASWNGQ
ncbi:MAG: hypothetical protein AB7V43_06135 [Acidimicrobiia bacterium]